MQHLNFKIPKHIREILILTILLAVPLITTAQDGFIKSHPQLAYWKLGSKPDVVIVLHGGPACHHKYLQPELDRLTESATVIYYDQRGCGESERGDSYFWQDHVRDLQRLIKAVAPQKRVFLAGSSWGSLLAILYAYSFPKDVKGLILTGTVRWLGEGKPYTRNRDLGYNKPHAQPMVEKTLARSINADGTTKIDTVEISKMVVTESGIQLSETLGSLMSAPVADSLAKIQTPIIIFNGKRHLRYDWVDGYMRLFRNAELVTFEVAGHDPWFSDPEQFAARCNAFMLRNK